MRVLKNITGAEDADFDEFCGRVGGAKNLPEQLFGGNTMEVQHKESGLSLRLDALGALRQWHADNLEPFQLKHAQQWRKARAASFETNEIANVVYDWWASLCLFCCFRILPGRSLLP